MSEITLDEEAHAASRYAYMDVIDRGGSHSEALVATIAAYLTADPSYAAGRRAGLEEALSLCRLYDSGAYAAAAAALASRLEAALSQEPTP